MGESTESSSDGFGQLGRLPMEVRRRIYILSGLPSQEYLSLDAHVLGLRVRPPIYSIGRSAREANDSKSSPNMGFESLAALLLTCRQVYNEISAILYAENRFIVQNLQILKFMRPTSMKHLKQLCILLYVVRGPRWPRIGSELHYPGHDLPLDPSESEGHVILAEWKDTVQHLAAHLVPGRVDLELVCEMTDHVFMVKQPEQHATDLVTQAFEGLPPLAALHLRLGARRNTKLVETARLIVEKNMPKKEEINPFRLMDLPQELRLEILRHTELVTPRRGVLWGSKAGFYLSDGPVRGPDRLPTLPCRVTFGNGCFCTRWHAAWSPRCRCWRDPSPLFLVSKQLTEDARRVFYGENAIRVHSTKGSGASALATTKFFSRGLLKTLGYQRVLHLPSYNLSDTSTVGEAEEGWMRLANDVLERNVLNLRELTIHGLRQDLPAYDTIIGTESILPMIRGFVNDLIWPLNQNGYGVRPLGTRRLVVELDRESDSCEMRYVAEEMKRPRSCDEEEWGRPVAAMVTGGWREEVHLRQYA